MNYGGKRGFVALSAALLAGTALVPAHAQSEPQGTADGRYGVADIVVTANKRSQSINDVGLTISAIGSEALEKQGVRTLDDLARSVPGLSFAPTDFGTPIFTLRGVGYYDNSLGGYPTTSVYVDEVPLPFSTLALHTNLDLERVEVLKGPQGTLFGQNSTGGAINFIAAKPTKDLAAGVDATIGRFGAGEANGFLSGPVTENLGFRLSGQYGFGSPWQRSYTRDDTIGRKNYLNGRLLLHWEPTSDFRVTLNVNGWRDTSEPQQPQYVALFPQVVLPDGTSAVSPDVAAFPFSPTTPRAADWSPENRPSSHKRQYQTSLRFDYDIADHIQLTSISNYVDYRVRQNLDLDGSPFESLEYGDEGYLRSFTQELRLAGGEGTPFRWVVGGNLELSHTYEEQYTFYKDSTIAAFFGISTGGNSTDQKFRNYAFFGNGEFDITPELTVKAGARYTNARVKGNTCAFDAGDGLVNGTALFFFGLMNPPGTPLPTLNIGDCIALGPDGQPGPYILTQTEDNVSWRVGLDYKPNRDLLLYANIAKGYKAGSFPALSALTYVSYVPVVQEALMDYEAGFKAQLLDRRVGLNGAVFYYDYTNKQLLTKAPDLIAGLLPVLANIPKSRVKGAELELNAAPLEGLRLSAAATYLDAKITDYVGVNAGGAVADFAGTDIPFTPKWQFAVNADYSPPVTGPVHPFIGASLTSRTSTTSIVGSAIGAIINPGYQSSVPIEDTYNVRGYTLLDLRAGVEADDGRWRLMVWGKNVTNQHYWNNVITAYENIVRYAGQPATYGVTFSYKFGQ